MSTFGILNILIRSQIQTLSKSAFKFNTTYIQRAYVIIRNETLNSFQERALSILYANECKSAFLPGQKKYFKKKNICKKKT